MKVTAVEIKDVEIPEQMQRAIARQAEAERERRAKIINSEGEFQAAQKLTDAADIISTNPASLQLRYLQTLLEIGSNQNTTVVFPLPMDMLEPFLGRADAQPAAARPKPPAPKPPPPPAAEPPPSPTRRPPERPPPLPRPERARDTHRPAHRAADDPRPGTRPSAPTSSARPTPSRGDAAESCPFCEGREDRTPPEVYATRPGGGEADTPGLDDAGRCRTSTRRSPVSRRTSGGRTEAASGGSGRGRRLRQRRRPAARLAPRRRARPLRLAAGDRRPRGDHQRARARRPRCRELDRRAARAPRSPTWRERMRAHAGAPYVQLIVNEGGGAGASLEHTHAQLYALPFVPADGRARARARRRLPRTHGGRRPARRDPGRGGAPPRAPGRDRRRGGADLPLGLALAVRAAGHPARRRRRASPRTTAARRCSAPRCACCAERFGEPPELNLWVRTAPRGAEQLPLARRHRAAARDQGRLRARAPASTSTSTRPSAPPPTCARRSLNRLGAMPPNPRPIPRFIADSTQEGIPHGRFAERLGDAFREACDGDRGPAGRRRAPTASSTGSPSAPGAAGSGSPAAPRAEGPDGDARALRPRLLRPAARRASPSDFRAKADFTDVLAEDNPDWKIDLNDDVIGRWRGENGRAGAVTLVWGRPLRAGRGRRHRRARRRDRRPGGGLQRPLHPDRPRRPRGLRRRRSSCRSSSGAGGPRSWPRRASTTDGRSSGCRSCRAAARSGSCRRAG